MEKLFNLNVEQYRAIIIFIVIVMFIVFRSVFRKMMFDRKRKKRREYYRNVYLKSDDWRRKRYVVLKRDNWCCVHCGNRATQVHHTRYAKKNIGKEPIMWLESVCDICHDSLHN